MAEAHDFGNAILTPGLIDLDALSDLDTTILAFDNHPAWQSGRVWPQTYMERGPYEMYSEDELAFQKRYAFQALLRNGITTALPIASLYYRAWGETVTEFAAAAKHNQDLAQQLEETARGGDVKATLAAFANLGRQGCGSCHETFRKAQG